MKYILVDWPDIQDYMSHPDYSKDCYYDPKKDVWFVPEEWLNWYPEPHYDSTKDWDDIWGIGPDIGDLEDAMG